MYTQWNNATQCTRSLARFSNSSGKFSSGICTWIGLLKTWEDICLPIQLTLISQ